MKEVIEIPVLSDVIRKIGVPLSLVTRANGFVFVSGTPPFDVRTGQLVRGDIEAQTEASLKAVKHCLEFAGFSLDKVVMCRAYLRGRRILAYGVRHRDRVVCSACVRRTPWLMWPALEPRRSRGRGFTHPDPRACP
jgi:enamine deaminase RidA (YjgF/YER057c/UK114 family)